MPRALSTEWFQQQLQDTSSWLQELDENPTPLLNFVANRKAYRLGIYFEHLIAFWLTHHPHYQLLAHDLQVFEGKQTKGAFDFLLSDGEHVHHWETCVKFYLSIDNSPEWMNWVGPHQKDRLGIKLNKTLHRQLHLSKTKSGEATLRKNNIAIPTEQKMWIKGILFSHWKANPVSPINGYPPEGIWLYADELPIYLAEKTNSQWFVREKPNWLSAIIDETMVPLQAVDLIKYPLVRTTMFSETQADNHYESKRIFICPSSHRNKWPTS